MVLYYDRISSCRIRRNTELTRSFTTVYGGRNRPPEYDQFDVDVIKQQLPRTLKTVKGTSEHHEISAEPDGLIFSKKTSDKPQLQFTLRFKKKKPMSEKFQIIIT